MEPKEAVLLFIMFLVFGVTSIALAARLAIRPIVDAIVRLREHSVALSSKPTADPQIAELKGEIEQLKIQVERLSEAEAFHRQLSAGHK